MDRFEWLSCQPWLLPWQGCEQAPELRCSSCTQGELKMCLKVNWVFQGFASFHTIAKNSGAGLSDDAEEEEEEENGPLSKDAAHLFFSIQSPLLDPAQLVLKLGITLKEPGTSCSYSRRVLLVFDDSSPYFLELGQVKTISTWKQEQGCRLCREIHIVSRDEGRGNPCACQQLPLYVTVRLRHVAFNIYSAVQSDEALATTSDNASPVTGVVDHLHKALGEERLQSTCGVMEADPVIYSSQATAEMNDLVNASNVLLQQFLIRLDCMSECAVKAVEVCSADVPWMTRLLHILAQHAAGHSERLTQLKALHYHLHYRLQALQEEEQAHITTMWGGSATQQQEARTLAVLALQHTMQQRERLEEALVWLELMNAAVKR